jgi:hypothetical protein
MPNFRSPLQKFLGTQRPALKKQTSKKTHQLKELEKGGLEAPTSHLEILAPPPGTEVPIKWRPPGSLDILWVLYQLTYFSLVFDGMLLFGSAGVFSSQ